MSILGRVSAGGRTSCAGAAPPGIWAGWAAAMWLTMACRAAAGSGSGAWNWHAGIRHARAMISSDYLLLDAWLVHDVGGDGREERSRDETCMKRHEEDLIEAS